MQSRISSLIPFFLITILSFMFVEGAYQGLEYFVLNSADNIKIEQKQQPEEIKQQNDSQAKRFDHRIIVQRNLFGSSTKSSIVEPVVSKPKTTDKTFEELDLVLMGTVSGSDNNNRAIILTKKTRNQELFSTGEVIEGALIKDIQRGKLVLSIDGKDEVLDMGEAANMRPIYKVQPSVNNPKRSSAIEPGIPHANINAAPTPRRRVIRRPPAHLNMPKRPIQ